MIVDAHCHILPPSFAERRRELAARDATFAAILANPAALIGAFYSLDAASERPDTQIHFLPGAARLEESGKLRMVATDGHRLAYVDRTLSSDLGGLDSGVIIPRKGLAELKKLVLALYTHPDARVRELCVHFMDQLHRD